MNAVLSFLLLLVLLGYMTVIMLSVYRPDILASLISWVERLRWLVERFWK